VSVMNPRMRRSGVLSCRILVGKSCEECVELAENLGQH